MKWAYTSAVIPTKLDEVKEILLKNRSIEDTDTFFSPLHPNDLTYAACNLDEKQIKKVHKRLEKAKASAEKVVIFGDYDADGITATAIVWLALKEFGITAQPFIPLRDTHGYGLSIGALEEVIAIHNPSVVITVDNGIVAHEAADFLADKGIDLLLSDHHQPEKKLPKATAVVHSTSLCGATVGWMMIRELVSKEYAESLLDLAGIGTIADQVPLTDSNRAFAYHGVAALRTTKRRGIRSLLATAKSDQRLLTSTTVGYLLAPRINAMGRLAHGMDALRLLCSQNPAQVAKLTTLLTETNSERQDLTRDLFEEALEKAKEQSEEHVIIVYSENYHEGIIGLIAGRLMERFWKPVIVLSVAKTTAKASVRSIPGIHITDFLRNFKEQMTSLGGHPMAAGFGVENTKLEALVAAIQKKARKAISTDILEQMLTVECQLSKELASLALLQVLEAFAPFGAANPYPVFALHDLEVASAKSMGKDGTHLVVTLSTAEDSYPLKVIGWRQARRLDQFEVGSKVTIAGYFEKNVWRDKEYLQFILKDVQQV